jgi:hypothetical protein
MTVPNNRPNFEIVLSESTTSIATTPVAMIFAVPTSGYIQRGIAVSAGTTTGTTTFAATVNGGSDIFAGALTIAAGAGNLNNPSVALPLTGASAVLVSEGDIITVTPSGGTGASIQGAVSLVIRPAG